MTDTLTDARTDRPVIDPADLYALMGPAALIAHIRACTNRLLDDQGPQLTAAQAILAHIIDEAVTEYEARADRPALARRLAAQRRELGEEAVQ